MIGAPNNSRGGGGGSASGSSSSNSVGAGAGASSTPPTSAAATVRAHRTSTATIRSSASSSYRAAAHQQYLQQATFHNVYRPVPPNAPQKPHPHHQQSSTVSAASNFPSPPTGGAQYATGSVPARVAVPPAFAAAAAAARHAAAHGIGPRPAASTTRLRTDHHHRHSASDPTGSSDHHGPSAGEDSGHGSSSSSSGTLLPSVFFQSAAFPGNYALVRTSESRCEFLPVVPSAPSKAVLAASKRAAARARRRITLIKPSKHSLRGRPAVLMAAETAEEAAAAEEEAEDELASLPGDKRDNGGDEGENDLHHADEPSDEEQDLDDEAAAEPEPVPRHPWGSEFLLLEYRRGAKPAPVTRETVKNGLPVLICARHGLMGLRRDLAEAEGRPASLIDEEAGKASADALAPQFIGFKDSGTLFTIQYPTSKTLFTIENVSNQGFSLRTDAGQYLCVSERHLSTTLSPTNNACTFRFIFVKNPRDPFGHAAAGRPIASSSSRPVSTTTSIGVPLTSRRAVSMIAPGTGTMNSTAANTPTTPAGYSMRTPTSAADSAAGSFARMSLNGSVVVPPPMRNHARHQQTSSSYYTPPAAMAAADMMTPPRHSQVAPPAPGPHAAMMTNRVSGEIAMTVTGPVPALSRSMGGGGNTAPPMPSVPKEWLTGPAGPPPLPPLPGAGGAAGGKNNLLTKVAYRVAIQDSKSRVLICDPLVKPRRMANLRGGGNDHHHHYDEVASHRSRSSGSSRGSRNDPYVLRLASVKDHSDSRILFFHVLVLPEGHLDDTSSVRTHDSNASIRADTSSVAASRLDEQLKYASALDLLDPAPKRVMFRSSDGRYLAVRMPAGYHQSRPRRPGSGPQVLANHHPGGSMHIKPASVQVLGSDDEDDDDTTAASDDELEGIGSLVLTSRPTAAGVWRYTQLPHSPLSFSLQSNVLRTYLSVHTPGPVAALPAKSVLSRALAGMGRSASPANNAAAASTTTLQATATTVGVREALTLFVPPTLQQAIALQAARGPPRNATYLAMAITGASLMGATAGIVNMVINANRPVNNSASSAAHADSAAAGAHGGAAAAPTGTTVTNGTTTATSAAAADAATHHTVATTATVATPYGAVDASVHPGDTVSNVHIDPGLDAAANHDATASATASTSAPHPFDGLSGPSVSDIANSHPHDLWSSQPMPGSSSAAAHDADVDSAAMLPPAHADVDTAHYYSVADLHAAGSEMHYMDAHQYHHDPSMYDTMHHDQYNPASSVHF